MQGLPSSRWSARWQSPVFISFTITSEKRSTWPDALGIRAIRDGEVRAWSAKGLRGISASIHINYTHLLLTFSYSLGLPIHFSLPQCIPSYLSFLLSLIGVILKNRIGSQRGTVDFQHVFLKNKMLSPLFDKVGFHSAAHWSVIV